MEFLGLLVVLFFLYLLIAPAIAWTKANTARAYAQELTERQAREVSDLRKEIRQLREQQAGLLQRVERLGTAPEAEPARAAAPETAPSAEPAQPVAGRAVFQAPEPELAPATPPAPAVIPGFDFSTADLGIPETPAAAAPPSATATPEPPRATPAATPRRPAHASWNLEPVEKPEEPAEAVEPVAQAASPASAWAEAGARPASAQAAEREPVWQPKPPVERPLPPRREPQEPGPIARLLTGVKDWLFGGNLVARLGLMILFIGVAFLLRFAAQKVVVPIEVRLAGIAAGAIGLLGWGWHIRLKRPGIALPTQGAALATLMLVVFGAYKIWKLIPSGPTFALLLVLVAFTCALALLQDALWLAIFGIVGGFAVPILTASGGGNHIALFSYYALLNAGILAIAWKRAWRVLNFLGFLFTFLIGTAWGAQNYSAEHYASSQAFLALFVAFYAAISILYAWHQAPRLKSYVDASLVFGVPIVAMGLQYGMVKDMHLGAALSAVAFGLFYAALGLGLWRWRQGTLRLLVESFFALAVVFGTLAIPLAFDGRWTSAAWALQGAGMVWIGLRQKQALVWRFGILLQFLSWIAFFRALTGLDPVAALREHISLGFLLLGACGVFLALLLLKQSRSQEDEATANGRFGGFASAFIVVAVLWLLAGLWVEVWLRTDGAERASLYVLTALALVYGLQWLGRRADWRVPDLLASAVTAVAGLTFLVLMARTMDWHNVSAYAAQDFGSFLRQSALLGALLLAGGALASAFAFRRHLAGAPDDAHAQRSAGAWLLVSLFWFAGFALNSGAHALAFLTRAQDGIAPWFQVQFWAAYGVGLALAATLYCWIARRFAFPNASQVQRVVWPLLSAVGLWIFVVQQSDWLHVERLLQFDWALAPAGDGGLGATWLALLGGPLAGTLVFLVLAAAAVYLSHARSPELADEQRQAALAVWLIGAGIVVHLLLVDVLAQFTTRALLASGAAQGSELGWLSYADARLVWMALFALLAQWMARGLAPLRWLMAPAAIVQAMGWIVLLVHAWTREELPSIGTGLALLLSWLGLAWCLRDWRARFEISNAGLIGLHFGRVLAPWLMLGPVISLNLWPWLVGPYEIGLENTEGGWVVEGMWPDYLAAWAMLGLLFLGLRQVRRDGWPLEPLQRWYGGVVIPLAAGWALLLAIYWNLRQDGGMAPLPYLPILNPLDLTSGFVALLLADLWRLHREDASEEQRRGVLRISMALGFAWFNLMLLRTAAQFLGLPYRFEALYASQFVQAMLSLVWTLCAFALMRFAARRLSKPLWMLGAALLGVVVLKLFLVDLRHAGGIARIVSFMGVGGLMLLIGYLAPLPREAGERR
ncbi:MAG: DUF2339 domain-containing protein [Xanthomonadales bacterium]|nr:DUF2339 domain-containing protein [Xanthomonadales bacterium]MCE7932034.1 DUF2339 domain-containing protein [Xanthomonadales bacterium PRO6]